jgi:hypothetical protein
LRWAVGAHSRSRSNQALTPSTYRRQDVALKREHFVDHLHETLTAMTGASLPRNECLARPTPGRRPTSRPSTRWAGCAGCAFADAGGGAVGPASAECQSGRSGATRGSRAGRAAHGNARCAGRADRGRWCHPRCRHPGRARRLNFATGWRRIRSRVGFEMQPMRSKSQTAWERPPSTQRWRRKQTIPKSGNIMRACGMRGSRWRRDASLSIFLTSRIRRNRQTNSHRNENPAPSPKRRGSARPS